MMMMTASERRVRFLFHSLHRRDHFTDFTCVYIPILMYFEWMLFVNVCNLFFVVWEFSWMIFARVFFCFVSRDKRIFF